MSCLARTGWVLGEYPNDPVQTGQERGVLERRSKVVLVTGWPKEETWDGEVGRDIIVFNEKHYI